MYKVSIIKCSRSVDFYLDKSNLNIYIFATKNGSIGNMLQRVEKSARIKKKRL